MTGARQLSDYNLYHARMAIFYQSSARASRWLKAALYAQNVLFVVRPADADAGTRPDALCLQTLSIINLVSGDTPKRFGFSCISGSRSGLPVSNDRGRSHLMDDANVVDTLSRSASPCS